MRKNLTQITVVVCLLLACQLPLEAQSQFDSYGQSDHEATQVTFTFCQENPDTNFELYGAAASVLDLPLDEGSFNALTSHGAFYDGVVNHMYINTNFDKKFSKVEILNKYASGLVYSGNITENPYSKFVTAIDPGTYLIILTNHEGDILVDEISVILAPRVEPLEELASEELHDDVLQAASR